MNRKVIVVDENYKSEDFIKFCKKMVVEFNNTTSPMKYSILLNNGQTLYFSIVDGILTLKLLSIKEKGYFSVNLDEYSKEKLNSVFSQISLYLTENRCFY